MTELVVDRFEVIDIDEQHGERLSGQHLLGDDVSERPAIEEPCQRIDGSLSPKGFALAAYSLQRVSISLVSKLHAHPRAQLDRALYGNVVVGARQEPARDEVFARGLARYQDDGNITSRFEHAELTADLEPGRRAQFEQNEIGLMLRHHVHDVVRRFQDVRLISLGLHHLVDTHPGRGGLRG